jgi:hypothetical protein
MLQIRIRDCRQSLSISAPEDLASHMSASHHVVSEGNGMMPTFLALSESLEAT